MKEIVYDNNLNHLNEALNCIIEFLFHDPVILFYFHTWVDTSIRLKYIMALILYVS